MCASLHNISWCDEEWRLQSNLEQQPGTSDMCIAHAIKDNNRPLWLLKGLYERKYEIKVLEAADKKGTCSIARTPRATVAEMYEAREDIDNFQMHTFCLPAW